MYRHYVHLIVSNMQFDCNYFGIFNVIMQIYFEGNNPTMVFNWACLIHTLLKNTW